MRKNPLKNMSAHGGIITSEFLETIQGENVKNPRVDPQCFATFNQPMPPKDKRELDQKIANSFKLLLERWDAISLRYQNMSVSDARSKWMIPLFKELGFDPDFRREEIVVGGDDKLRFRLSHRGWSSESAPKIHMVAPSQDLEEASDGGEGEVVRRGRTRSPHDEMQAYLNVTKGLKWGIVTNGILLRVLREYFHTTTKGYVEFDIENIFRERSFTDFRAMYRMVHASRFLPDKDGISPLEQFYKESVAAGVKVGEDLRKNVKKAIEALGNGFLTPELTKKMIEDEELCKAYYAELLRVIYRLLFLLFAEQRAMLPTKESLYIEEYSITRLRQMAEERRGKDDHKDLWEGLKVTFHMLKKGCPPLKVFGYNGTLFDDSEIPTLKELPCKNQDILEAVRNLTLIEEERVLKRINYLDLGVSEIGSIYESLLDYSPKVFATEQEIEGQKIPANTFVLDPRGAARKTSGSYYTNPRLIDELIKSALKPVFEDRISKATDKEKALLSIKVCDPACGSGAFLIAANNFLGKELAKLRTNQSEPPDKEIKKATRDVLQHCIYGVDLNPMATELAKVSLWINSCLENLPLNFLDHHIKCGNSLIGTTTILIKSGIPNEAFDALDDDDKEISKKIKLQNKIQRQDKLIDEFFVGKTVNIAKEYSLLDELDEKSTQDVEEKKRRYLSLISAQDLKKQKSIANSWTAAFFWPLKTGKSKPPTQGVLRLLQNRGIEAIDNPTKVMIDEIATEYNFFHWYLEFPEIFNAEKDGFDCILGNPPWETIEFKEIEFFEQHLPEIAKIGSSARKKEIKKLKDLNFNLWSAFQKENRLPNAVRKFMHNSGRFPLTGRGRTNSYSVFAELSYCILNKNGRAGIILPTGIATDDNNKEFFAEIAQANCLVSLFDFENKEGIFPDVHRSFKFCLFTMQRLQTNKEAEFMFFLTSPERLADEDKRFALNAQDFVLLNPNTKTCPIFRSKTDAELTKKIYKRIGVLVNEGHSDPWHVYFRQGLFNMATDSNLFRDSSSLQQEGFVLKGNVFHKNQVRYLPLYEGKMIWIFNHRAGSVDYRGNVVPGRHDVITSEPEQLCNPHFVPMPRFWVNEKEVSSRIPEKRSWFLGFRDITNASSERTAIFSIVPFAGVGHQMPLVFFKNATPSQILAFLANVNSFIFDYVARQKLGGNHMTYFILKQLPVLPPERYDSELLSSIASRVLELVYNSWDLQGLATDLGYTDSYGEPLPPIIWDDSRRLDIQCELDAIFFTIYGLSKEEVEYVMETFAIIKREEIEKYGEFRTKSLILRYFEKYNKTGNY